MKPVTDPALLAQLNDNSGKPVTDPNLLAQLDGAPSDTPRPSFLQTMSNAADRIQGSMPYAAGLMAPTLGLGYKAAENMNEASGRLGEATTEAAGRAGVPGVGAAVLGTGAAMFSNPMTYVDPGAGLAGKFAKPVVPAERAFDVATAQKYNLPMTRADLTGSKSASLVETGLGRSITGSGPLQRLAQQKLAAVEAAKSKIGSTFGTSEPLSASGLEAKMSMQSQLASQAGFARQLYKDIPDVPIRTPNLEKALNETDFSAIDKSAHPTIRDVRARIIGEAPPTEETFQPSFGSKQRTQTVETAGGIQAVPGEGNMYLPPGEQKITSDLTSQYRVKPATPDLPVVKPGAKTGDIHGLFSYNSNINQEGQMRSMYTLYGDAEHPLIKPGEGLPGAGNTTRTLDWFKERGIPITGREPRTVGKWDPLDDLSTPRTQSFQQLNDLRNQLSKEIQSDTVYNPFGNQVGPKAKSLIPLKKALDKDIQDHVKGQSTPYGKMEANDFSEKFNAANTYYGAYKSLRSNKLIHKLSKVNESDIPQTIFGGGSIEDVKVAKRAMGTEGFNASKKQFFNDLLESKNIDTKLAKYEPEFLTGVFNPDELTALREASSLKKTSLTAEGMAGNPSGTAQVLGSMATGGALMHAATKAIAHPLQAAGEAAVALGGPWLGTKAYLGTTHGIPASFGRGSMYTTRFATAGESAINSERRKSFLSEYVDRVIVGKK